MKMEIDMNNLSANERAELMQLLKKGVGKFNVETFNSTIIRKVEDTIDDIENREWHVGESLFVPMKDGRTIEFIVAHRNEDEEAYFVSKDCIGKSTMTDMKSFLSKFESNLPENLLAIMRNVRHVFKGEKVFSGKIFIPSLGNVNGARECSAKDDEQFFLFKTEAGRVANLDGETVWWWTDSPNVDSSSNFWGVLTNGYYNNGNYANNFNGVRVGFKI